MRSSYLIEKRKKRMNEHDGGEYDNFSYLISYNESKMWQLLSSQFQRFIFSVTIGQQLVD